MYGQWSPLVFATVMAEALQLAPAGSAPNVAPPYCGLFRSNCQRIRKQRLVNRDSDAAAHVNLSIGSTETTSGPVEGWSASTYLMRVRWLPRSGCTMFNSTALNPE